MSKELCYVGDPCYVILDEEWHKVVKTIYPKGTSKADYSKVAINGESFFMSGTYHGDGEYTLKDARGVATLSLGVDSGSLAAIPLRIFPPADREEVKKSYLGAIVEIDLVNCSEEDGKFTFDQYTVNTKPIELEEDVPVSLTVYYTASNQVSVESLEHKLGIKWHDINTWWVKHDEFYATLGNGDTVSCDLDSGCDWDFVDWKHPDLIRVYDKNNQCIEERD